MEADKKLKVRINMLTGTSDCASAVVDIGGEVSVINNYPMNDDTSPKDREELLIDRAFYLQGKERPSNDD